jgi:thiol reductant ABC exporter CydC subunit
MHARLLNLLMPFWPWAILVVGLSFGTIAAGIALTAAASYLISKAAIAPDLAALTLIFTSVRLFAILRAALRYFERLLGHILTFRALAHLRAWFFAAIEPSAPARLDQHQSGDLLARSVADIQTLEGFYVRVLVPFAAALLVALFASGLLRVFDWQFAIVVLVYMVATGFLLPVVVQRLSAGPANAQADTRGKLDSLLVDNVQGLPDLLLHDRAETHAAQVLATGARLSAQQERQAALRGTGNGLGALFTSLAAITIVLIATPMVTSGRLDPVYFAMLPLAALACYEAVQPLTAGLQHFEASKTAGRRVFELIDAPPEVTEPARPVAWPRNPGIELRGVSFRYAPREPLVLDRLTFSLPAGESLAISGVSGAGKSTVVDLLLRFREYQAGEIRLGARELREYSPDTVRAVLGVVPQQVHLFDVSVRDNLLLARPDATAAQIGAACRQALVDEFIEALPDGYETRCGEDGARFSGGERQRIAIARMILKDAPIAILDEPTANLDVDTEQRLMASMAPFLNGRTVLIISHREGVRGCAKKAIELSRP